MRHLGFGAFHKKKIKLGTKIDDQTTLNILLTSFQDKTKDK